MELLIDLQNKNRGKKNIELSWEILVSERPKGLLSSLRFIKKHERIDRQVSLTMTDLSISPELICNEEDLVSIVYNTTEFRQESFPVLMQLEQKKTSFQLYLNQDAICDCNERQQRIPKTYCISFNLVLSDIDGNVIDTRNFSIDIKFAILDIKPKVKINISKSHVQYNSQLTNVKVGEVACWIDEDFKYSPNSIVKAKIKLSDGIEDLDNIVFFREKGECTQIISSLLHASRINLRKFDIFLDFTKIQNPIELSKKYTIIVQPQYSLEYSPEIVQPLSEELDNLFVDKDSQGTELKVSVVDDSNGEQIYTESGKSIFLSKYGFVPFSKMQSQVTIDLINIATDSSRPMAGLYVRNLSITDSTENNVKVVNEKEYPISQFTRVYGDNCTAMQGVSGYFVKNGNDAKTTLYVCFNPSEIADVLNSNSDCDFQVETLLSFDYCENKDGKPLSELEYKTFKIPLIWNMQLKPYPQWLCVDYGSSAIVCQYDKDIINLREQKEKLYSNPSNELDDFEEDTLEKGTQFLSSDILMHTVPPNQDFSALCSEQLEECPYNNIAICLSPTSSLMTKEIHTILPCLKILVGNEFLPKYRYYEMFRYPRLEPKSGIVKRITAKESVDEEKSLMRVSSVFEEAYNNLFRYYVSPVTGDKRHLNKLVLTYPNTYSPVHINTLRRIVLKTFPYIREGFLKFVSESDAVASYYISHWDEFNPGMDIWRKTKETILVYDMGAGTLDISVFNKIVDESQKIDVDIIGKIGTGKAGNYLDFVLAEIICDILHLEQANLASTKFVNNEEIRIERTKLKFVIKDVIKPALVPNIVLQIKLGGRCYRVDTNNILNHPKFVNYIDAVTANIVTQLKKYMENSSFNIDTVILSGRSCKLGVLRSALKNSLESLSVDEIHYVEFDGMDNKEKTIVVEGAISQANIFDIPTSEVKVRSRRLYASYGLVFKGLGGKWHYQELLNHKDIPYITEEGTFNSNNTSVKGTANSEYIRLVQTYMSAEETEKCYNNGEFEFISDMEEYNMDDFNNPNELNVRLRLDKLNNISLFVNGKIGVGTPPKGVDLQSEITKKSIWPITI